MRLGGGLSTKGTYRRRSMFPPSLCTLWDRVPVRSKMRVGTKVIPGRATYCSLNARKTECYPIILALTASTTYISSDRSRTDVSQRRGRNRNESSEGSPTHDFGLQGRFSVVEMTDETERHTRIYTGTLGAYCSGPFTHSGPGVRRAQGQ